MSEAWAIIPAGGTGERFSIHQDKLTTHLAGLPILVRTVKTLLNAEKIAGAILVVHPDKKTIYQHLIQEYTYRKPILFVTGGATRRDSVYNGLVALPDTATITVIHDAARPLINTEVINEAIVRVEKGDSGVVVGVPLYDTVKQSIAPDNRTILQTLDRRVLWRAQTPQVFSKNLILQAHQAVPSQEVITDDAQLLEISGLATVEMLPGDDCNIKITTPGDLVMAEALLKVEHSFEHS